MIAAAAPASSWPAIAQVIVRDRSISREEAAKNPAWAKIYSEFEKYRKSQNAWFSVAEAGFDRFMQSVR